MFTTQIPSKPKFSIDKLRTETARMAESNSHCLLLGKSINKRHTAVNVELRHTVFPTESMTCRVLILATVNNNGNRTTMEYISLQLCATIRHAAAAARGAVSGCSSPELQTSSSHSLCS